MEEYLKKAKSEFYLKFIIPALKLLWSTDNVRITAVVDASEIVRSIRGYVKGNCFQPILLRLSEIGTVEFVAPFVLKEEVKRNLEDMDKNEGINLSETMPLWKDIEKNIYFVKPSEKNLKVAENILPNEKDKNDRKYAAVALDLGGKVITHNYKEFSKFGKDMYCSTNELGSFSMKMSKVGFSIVVVSGAQAKLIFDIGSFSVSVGKMFSNYLFRIISNLSSTVLNNFTPLISIALLGVILWKLFPRFRGLTNSILNFLKEIYQKLKSKLSKKLSDLKVISEELYNFVVPYVREFKEYVDKLFEEKEEWNKPPYVSSQ